MTLEEQIIFLENDIEKLNSLVYQQDKRIKFLEKSIKLLYKNIQQFKQEDDIPPHY